MRSNLKIVNRTQYFNPELTKVSLELLNPNSFRFKSVKQQSYRVRLYYEYLYNQKCGGCTYFYTLTYNDASIPVYLGHKCFDYKDLSEFLNGGFKKILLRKYHCHFKYFVGAELGEGKGKRGYENNPHYHALFFIYPEKGFSPIDPITFRSLVRKYWQGFDQDERYFPFKNCKFGISKEGENVGLVTDYRACMYCAKYVTKDVGLKKFEKVVFETRQNYYFDLFYKDMRIRNNWFHEFVVPRFSSYCQDLPNKQDWHFLYSDIVRSLAPKLFSIIGNLSIYHTLDFFDSFLKESNLESDFQEYVLALSIDNAKLDLNLFRNRYSNKCRISHGVGDYALHNIVNDFSVSLPDKKGAYQIVPLSLYYLRKRYYKVERNNFGNNVYVLTDDGIEYKCRAFDSLYNSLFQRVMALLKSQYLIYCGDYDEVCKRYVSYKLVYEGRFYDVKKVVPLLPKRDYRKFLQPSYYCSDFSPFALNDFFKDENSDFRSYDDHYYFRYYINTFRYFDSVLDEYFVSNDKRLEDLNNKYKIVKQFHDKIKLRSFYSNLNF